MARSLRRTFQYASLGASRAALHLDLFEPPTPGPVPGGTEACGRFAVGRAEGGKGKRSGMFSDEMVKTFEEILGRYPVKRSALIPILHEVQARDGYLTQEALEEVARYLGLHPMEVAETASFYDLLHLRPVGRFEILYCHNLSCTLGGGERVLAHLEKALGITAGETTPDGLFTLRRMECLASCGTAPVMQVNGEYYENLTEARVEQILAELRQRAAGT